MGRSGSAAGPADGDDLLQELAVHRPRRRARADVADGQARQGSHPRLRADQRVLHPFLAHNIIRRRRVQAGLLQRRLQAPGAIAHSAAPFAKVEDSRTPGLLNDPRCLDRGQQVHVAAEDSIGTEHPHKNLLVLHAILHGENGRPGPRRGAQSRRGLLGIKGLHGEKHEIRGRSVGRIVCRVSAGEELAVHCAQLDPALATQGFQVRPPRDKCDAVAGVCQHAAVVAAEAAGADNRDVHY